MSWYEKLANEKIDLMICHIPPLHPPISDTEKIPVIIARYSCTLLDLWSPAYLGKFELDGTQFYINPLKYTKEGNVQEIANIEIKS